MPSRQSCRCSVGLVRIPRPPSTHVASSSSRASHHHEREILRFPQKQKQNRLLYLCLCVLSPSEDNVNGSLVDGREVSRTGTQMERVEREVVLIRERNNMEGACDMRCLDVKMKCSCEGYNTSCGLGCEALTTREKITCAEVSNARAQASGWSVMFTHTVAHKGVAIACKRYTLIGKILAQTHFDVCDHEEDCHHADGCHPW